MRHLRILFVLCLASACGGSSAGDSDAGGNGDGSVNVDADPNGDSGVDFADADPNAPDAGASSGCDPSGPQCNNCEDDDGDGLIDGFDPECTGLLDNDEDSFATGIPGDNRSNSGVQDCFFDGDSGGGNDGCYILDCCFEDPRTCTPEEETNVGTSTGNAGCVGSDECINNCGPLAPPGCDCFGCCTICDPDNPTDCRDVYLPTDPNSPCGAENLDACDTCTQNDSCGNPCDNDECELCPGQSPDDLPSHCTDQTCPDNQTVCTDQSDCLDTEYCSNGCCIGVVVD